MVGDSSDRLERAGVADTLSALQISDSLHEQVRGRAPRVALTGQARRLMPRTWKPALIRNFSGQVVPSWPATPLLMAAPWLGVMFTTIPQ